MKHAYRVSRSLPIIDRLITIIGSASPITTGISSMRALLRLHRTVAAAASSHSAQQTRSLSILGTIFGIGEFEGARNQSLRATTSKRQAYDLALLEVRPSSTCSFSHWR